MNHCLELTISSGCSPFSKKRTAWRIGFGSPTKAPCSLSSSTISFLAASGLLPWSLA
jgi:hypothetical protein